MASLSPSSRDLSAHTLSPADRTRREVLTAQLLERIQQTSDAAERRQLVEEVFDMHLEVALSIAHRYRDRGADLDDLEQAACLGLVNAIRRYRPDAATPFIGFAIPTIRGELKRYFRDYAWTIRIPRRLQEIQWLIAARGPRLKQELNREPTRAELAACLEIDLAEVDRALAAKGCFNVLSLDQPLDPAGNLTLADLVAGDQDVTLGRFEEVDQLQPVLDDLGPRERRILELRFVEGWTQAEIGADIGVSQMQVSRILGRILDDLREQLLRSEAA
ncbi:MAG: polymerase sigma-B factor [Kribbellaceae bacterium]|nr:polymerase sigma-B factor [Kribbellaceae bacterium]